MAGEDSPDLSRTLKRTIQKIKLASEMHVAPTTDISNWYFKHLKGRTVLPVNDFVVFLFLDTFRIQ